MTQQPNFILFMTDQQRADHLSCNGNSTLKTPNIDSLSRSGVNFDRCYVANPICMPNRASIMTGRMPSIHGVRSNGIPLARESRTFVEELKTAGYSTALIGKAHFQNMTGMDREFTPKGAEGLVDDNNQIRESVRRNNTGGFYESENTLLWREDSNHQTSLPFYGFDHVELATWHGDLVGGAYERWLSERIDNSSELRGADNAFESNNFSVPQAWRTQIPEGCYPSAFVAEKTIEFIDHHATEGDGQPFFIQASFPDPHHPFTPPGKYWEMYNPDDMELPASFEKGDTPILQHMRDARKKENDFREGQQPFAISAREAREAIALTYGMISMIDDQIGRVLAHLEESGLIENTVLIFTSDHGELMGDHGILLKGPLHYQGVIRVPLIWSDPKKSQAVRSDDLVSSIDIPATILDRAGVTSFYGMQGKSLLELANTGDNSREAVLIEDDRERVYLNFDRPQRLRTIVTKQHRMTLFRPMDWGELYDLKSDPDENHNLWNQPVAKEIQAELTRKLLELMIDFQDWTPAMTGRA